MAADSVNFIDENDARSILFALLEKIADAARAHTDKHFDEVRAGNREEGNVGFAGNGPRQQSLAGAWRPNEQHALGNPAAKFLEFLRILQELNNFLEFFLGFIGSGDVLKRSLFLLRREQTRARLPKTKSLVSARLHLAHQEKAETDEKNQRSSVKKNENPIAAAHFFDLDGDALIAKLFGNIWRGFLENADMELTIAGASVFALEFVDIGSDVQRNFLDVSRFDLLHELAEARFILARLRAVGGHQLPEHHAQKDNRDPKEYGFCRGTRIHCTLTKIPKSLNLQNRSLALLGAFSWRHLCAGRNTRKVAASAVCGSQTVANPQLIRCDPEAKVIRLQGHATLLRLVQQHGEAQRTRPAFAHPAQ